MKRILSALVVVLASAGIASAQGAKRPLSLDDLGKHQGGARSAVRARRQVGRLRRVADRRQGGQAGQRPHLDRRPRRTERAADHVEHRERVGAAVQPRRQVPVVHLVAPGQGEGQPGVAARSQRRRGVPADRGQGTAAGLRMVARLEAPRAGRRRSGSGCAGRQPRRQATPAIANEGAEADRDRSLQVQAGRPGLSAVGPPHLRLPVRHRDEEARSPDEGQGGRVVAVVVARRHAHRVHEQPRTRIPIASRRASCSSSRRRQDRSRRR